MHRWLCTTAPLLIGSIAAGAIHAAPASGACPGMYRASLPHAGQPGADDTAFMRMFAAAIAVDPLRLCAGCHDGTVVRFEGDMRPGDFIRANPAGLVPVGFGARP